MNSLRPFGRKKMNKNPRTSRAPSRRRLMLESLEERIVLSLTYMTQPQTVITGQILAPIKVQGTAANIPVTISLNEQSISGTPLLGGTGTPLLGGTVTQNTDANKIATFSNLYVFGGTGQSALVTHDDFTLTASAASPTPGAPLDLATSTAFQVNPGGDHLYVSSTIPTTAAGASLGTITVQELDVNGNVVTTDSQTVVGLYFESNPGAAQFLDAKTGAALGTTIMATMSQGVATFVNPATGNNLAMDKAAIGYTLGVQATTANNGSTILPTTSNAFVITAGAPTGLGFLTQPTLTDCERCGYERPDLDDQRVQPEPRLRQHMEWCDRGARRQVRQSGDEWNQRRQRDNHRDIGRRQDDSLRLIDGSHRDQYGTHRPDHRCRRL